ncbi:hypothetical protein ACLB2K_069816 [Fragaria x ananassa]|uniref:CASP-like protein 4D1 n=1 Tax=Fragaria vesca subsp. vesca TaxID=101020 RepID=UPI0005CA906D|nr:PREDICTED: CASP-like protein 4D1 [Fragaria vesca subsp. vesca]
MAAMLPPPVARIVILVLRILITITLFASFIIVVTNSQDYYDLGLHQRRTWHFTDEIGLQYMAATLGLGIVFSIYGTAVMALRIKRGNDEGNLLIDFYGQKVLSNLLVTATVAAFLTIQKFYKEREDNLKIFPQSDLGTFEYYWGRYRTSSGLVILAFFFSFALSVLSTHRLASRIE